jgi:hypothetical protein
MSLDKVGLVLIVFSLDMEVVRKLRGVLYLLLDPRSCHFTLLRVRVVMLLIREEIFERWNVFDINSLLFFLRI